MTVFEVIVMHFFFIIWPGLTFAYVVNNAMQYGRKPAMMFALGDVLGGGVLKFLGLAGLGAFLNLNPIFYKTMQVIGMCYILHLVYEMLVDGTYSNKVSKLGKAAKKDADFLRYGFTFSISYIVAIILYMTIFSSMKPEISVFTKALLILWMMFFNGAYHFLVITVMTNERLNKKISKHLGTLRKISALFVVYFVGKMAYGIFSALF